MQSPAWQRGSGPGLPNPPSKRPSWDSLAGVPPLEREGGFCPVLSAASGPVTVWTPAWAAWFLGPWGQGRGLWERGGGSGAGSVLLPRFPSAASNPWVAAGPGCPLRLKCLWSICPWVWSWRRGLCRGLSCFSASTRGRTTPGPAARPASRPHTTAGENHHSWRERRGLTTTQVRVLGRALPAGTRLTERDSWVSGEAVRRGLPRTLGQCVILGSAQGLQDRGGLLLLPIVTQQQPMI